MESFEGKGEILKIDEEQRNVFGIFNMSMLKGELLVDKEDDVILTKELERAAYDFVLKARIASQGHRRDKNDDPIEVGRLIESMVFTKEKMGILEKVLKEMGANATIDLDSEFWFGGFHIDDDVIWKGVKNGDFEAFSIGGHAHRVELEV